MSCFSLVSKCVKHDDPFRKNRLALIFTGMFEMCHGFQIKCAALKLSIWPRNLQRGTCYFPLPCVNVQHIKKNPHGNFWCSNSHMIWMGNSHVSDVDLNLFTEADSCLDCTALSSYCPYSFRQKGANETHRQTSEFKKRNVAVSHVWTKPSASQRITCNTNCRLTAGQITLTLPTLQSLLMSIISINKPTFKDTC